MPSAELELAAAKVKTLTESPSNESLLELYALFNTVGDNNTERPRMFDLKGRAKWDAWISKKGMSSEEAEKKYIGLVAKLTA